MGMLTVRNVPDDVHRALRLQAASHGRSTEAEVRAILEKAVKPQERIRAGDAIAALAQGARLTDKDVAIMNRARDTKPAQPMRFD
ncbi:FitA-like ribbon-helix-helix domain-containing protein [Caenimonas koreensis]|uniref:FitA-like ribbon-helix-helix domain-containing protein n=1 Tax=Caenimonas koreensis TaxID=367474 RepID=UPI00378349A7